MADLRLASCLKSAREAVRITLKEAAEKLGYNSYQTLSKIEEGKREVKVSELSSFAKVYFCNIGYLLGEQEEIKPSTLVWRKAPEEAKRKEIESYIFYLSTQYHFFESLLGLAPEENFRFVDVALEDIRTNNNIDKLAQKASDLLGLGKRPAFMLAKILEQNYGVKILFQPLITIGSAASTIHPEYGAIIVINNDEAPWRMNYDLAHELFHLITWNIIPDEVLSDKSYLDGIDKKAERFASTLLLPSTEIRNTIEMKLERQKSFSYSDLVDISRDFGVSTTALLYRMANLRFIKWEDVNRIASDEQLVALDRNARKSDWRNKPVSERFYLLAIRCLRKGVISRGKFAEVVEIDRCDIDEFVEDYGLMESEGDVVEIMAS